jgi:hypothetical protein
VPPLRLYDHLADEETSPFAPPPQATAATDESEPEAGSGDEPEAAETGSHPSPFAPVADGPTPTPTTAPPPPPPPGAPLLPVTAAPSGWGPPEAESASDGSSTPPRPPV